MRVLFTVDGRPLGKERPRGFPVQKDVVSVEEGKLVHRKKVSARFLTPQQTKDYEESIRWAYRAAAKGAFFSAERPVFVTIQAFFPVPKSFTKAKREKALARMIYPTVKADWDNIGKAVCDALNKLAYPDDKQVVGGLVTKLYGEKERLLVELTDELPSFMLPKSKEELS